MLERVGITPAALVRRGLSELEPAERELARAVTELARDAGALTDAPPDYLGPLFRRAEADHALPAGLLAALARVVSSDRPDLETGHAVGLLALERARVPDAAAHVIDRAALARGDAAAVRALLMHTNRAAGRLAALRTEYGLAGAVLEYVRAAGLEDAAAPAVVGVWLLQRARALPPELFQILAGLEGEGGGV